MAAIQDRGPFKPGGNGSVFAKAARIQASIQKPGRRAASNPLLNPGQPLSGNALQRAASSLTNAQTAGPFAELAKALAASNAHTAGTMKLAGSTFNQLGQQAQQGYGDEQQNAANLNSQLQGIAGNTNTQLGQIGQNATDSLLSHSPQGDGGLATSALAALATDLARQKGIAAQQQGNQQAFGANQGANYSGLAASQLGTNAVAGTDALKSIAQSGTVANQPLNAKVADLQAQRGALYATNLGKLRQQEINNRITETGLGIKQQSIGAANARTAATIQGENQRNQNTVAGANARNANTVAAQNARSTASLNERTRHDKASEALQQAAQNLQSGKGRSKPLAQSQQNTLYGNLDTMIGLVGALQRPHQVTDATGKTVTKPAESEATIKHALSLGTASPHLPAQTDVLIEAAYELLGYGHLLSQTARAMHGMGLRGGTFRGRPIQVGPPPQGLGGVGVGGVASTLGGVGSAIGGA